MAAGGGACFELPRTTVEALDVADNPVPAALDILWRGAHDIVEVDDAAVGAAMQALFDDTHQVAEGAGAAALAALLADPARAGARCGIILSGGNVDRALYREVLG